MISVLSNRSQTWHRSRVIHYILTPTPDIPNNSRNKFCSRATAVVMLHAPFATRICLPPHMNLHLAKLHNHVFIRSIYGLKVKVFHNISGIQAKIFPSQLKVTCAVALAQACHLYLILGYTYNVIPRICEYVFFGLVAYALIVSFRPIQISQWYLISPWATLTYRLN